MLCYHRTTRAAADAILAEGFRDATGNFLTADEHTGVWVSDVPVGSGEGASGVVLLAVEVDESIFGAHEWAGEDWKPYREALIPAAVLNVHTISEVDEDTAEERRQMVELMAPRLPSWRTSVKPSSRTPRTTPSGSASPRPRTSKTTGSTMRLLLQSQRARCSA
jgi:hypothetical protein